ncbi:YafY family transcriptional regulator [Paenibacillus antri]|uniref:YafY family transcriptional regulator n=1 Tax=Paenibacillus antri TaxID=2582848 RepID=A0A5R9G2W6_9BACL|nr:YafY family protein [Paenibacillus antri]TLS48470.1 YafY family transcriptional regulator [Paenibacillus antri]
MTRSQRLMELLVEINRRRQFTAGEMAEAFGVSKRTILRDLQELEAIGVPLYSEVGPHGGYRLMKERLLPPIAFTEEEAAAMFLAYESLQQLGELPFEAETRTALAKFYSYMPADAKQRIDSMRHRIEFKIPKRPVGSPHLKLLLSASVARQPLRIVYDSKEGAQERTIHPVGVYAENGFWYCPAYCRLREDYRLFRADRILEAEPDGDAPSDVPSADVHLGDWRRHASDTFFRWVSLEVRLTRNGVRRAIAEEWMADGIQVNEDGSGSYAGRIPKPDLSYFASLFLSMGTDAEVIEPAELVDDIRDRLRQLQQQYL